MAPIEPGKVRPGTKLLVDGDAWNVVDFSHTKPGKGQAFVTVKIKSLTTGRVLERTYKIGEMLETADVTRKTCQYLYDDPDGYHFMDLQTYEQFTLQEDDLGFSVKFMQPEMEVIAAFWNNRPISIDLPPKITL